ncbi:MAG: phosphoesterase [Planctomycetaceae bacterium]|nr:phosphoesterase [Planctomycetaceae bacterium]
MFPDASFDELYVISDLHMGGAAGFQMFSEGALLKKWISQLAQRPSAKTIALLINGDFVDFLAEPGAVYFDHGGAEQKLERIAQDASFRSVWQALRALVKQPGRRLIFTIGNHDIELMLPWVRESLLRLIAGDDDLAQHRITLALDGSGYRCKVGPATVYCVHGNDVDTWNITDYERIRRIVRDTSRGRNIEPWIPNAGSKLVIDVMNDVKKKYPFVDLLKPEFEAVVPIVYSLDPSQGEKLDSILRVVRRLTWDGVKRSIRLLAAEKQAGTTQSDGQPGELLGSLLATRAGFAGFMPDSNQSLVEALLKAAHAELVGTVNRVNGATVTPQESADDKGAQRLGVFRAMYNWWTAKPKEEILRSALDGLMKYQGFDLQHVDNTFQRIDESVAANIDFVVTGHTHQERALRRRQGQGFYYNSGTWVPLIRLTPDILSSQPNFRQVYAAFERGTISALNVLKPPILMMRPAVVAIKRRGEVVEGTLNRVVAKGGTIELQEVEGSRFVR